MEYNDLKLLNQQYLDFLNDVGISYNKSAILVRQQSLKQDLETNSKESKHPILDALQMWLEETPKSRMIALDLASKQMHRWFGGAKTKKNYYCPSAINSVFRWRIFIKDFLEGCLAFSDLVNLDGITYSTWYKKFNDNFLEIIKEAYQGLSSSDSEDRDFKSLPKMITPKGTAKDIINVFKTTDTINLVSINTIHSVKGKDFDSVMVVSSIRNTGSGHWKQWIEKELESGRIGYVANTRAKYSLVWAVPTLKQEERDMLESYGFKNALKTLEPALL